MESKDGSLQETAGDVSELESSFQRLDELIPKVEQLVQKLKDAKQFYTANTTHPNTPEGVSLVGDENREKLVESSKKRQRILHEKQKQKEEDSGMEQDIYLSEEAANAKIARDIAPEIEINKLLDELRDLVTEKCRKMTIEEKKKLRAAIAQLSPQGVDKVIHFLAAKDPNFRVKVEIDLDAQSDSTLWQLKSFVGYTLQAEIIKFFK